MEDTAFEADIEQGVSPSSGTSPFSANDRDFDDFASPAGETVMAEKGATPSAPIQSGSQLKKIMDQFYKDVDSIKSDIDDVKDATRHILELHEKVFSSTVDQRDREYSLEMRGTVDATNKTAKRTKNLLALLKEENATYRKDKKLGASDMRYAIYIFFLFV